MLDIQTILAPIDFSDNSVAAAEHAGALADRLGSRVIVAHFIPPAPYEYAAFDEGFYAAAAWADTGEAKAVLEKRLRDLVAGALPGREVEQIVRQGDPVTGIEELVKEREVGMIVMPTHGYGPFRRMLLGSVTNKVLHDLTLPIFTGAHVPEIKLRNREPYKRIACAVDLPPHGEETLRWAWDFAQACKQDLIVIHAAPRVESGGTFGDWFPPEIREDLIQHSREAVDEMIAKVGCRAEVHIDSAEPVAYVAERARELGADVLIIGRNPHGGVWSGLRRHANAIIRTAPCSVISV